MYQVRYNFDPNERVFIVNRTQNTIVEGTVLSVKLEISNNITFVTPTPNLTPTVTPSPTKTATISLTPSITPTISTSPTLTVLPSNTPTVSITPTTFDPPLTIFSTYIVLLDNNNTIFVDGNNVYPTLFDAKRLYRPILA